MDKNSIPEEKYLAGLLTKYTDALLDNKVLPVINEQAGVELVNLVKTVHTFHAASSLIEPDPVFKKRVLQKVQKEWKSGLFSKNESIPQLIRSILRTIEQPVNKRIAVTAGIVILIMAGIFSLVNYYEPVTQALQGTADNWGTGITIAVVVIAAILLAWLMIKEKK
jgi:hypothetical protein